MSGIKLFGLIILRALVLLSVLLVEVTEATAATYYVAPNGSDTNDGSINAPFQTIQKAVDVVGPGDKVIVKAGVYYERLQIKTSGVLGDPIVFEGERGPNNEFLTIIDGGEPATNWSIHEEGSDYRIWKTTHLPNYTPGNMVWGDKQIPQHRRDSNYFPLWDWLRSSLSATFKNHFCSQINVHFWEVMNVIWTLENNIAYIRFRDKSVNPNNENLRWSGLYRGKSYRDIPPTEGVVLFIRDKSYNTFRDLRLQGASHPVIITGNHAHHNIVEDSYIQNGTDRVNIQNGAHDNTIRNCTITMNFSGQVQPGAWSCRKPKKEFIYHYYKRAVSEIETSEDRNVMIMSAGVGNKISNNHIFGGLFGLQFFSTNDVTIDHNEIHAHSSGGVRPGSGLTNFYFHDNLLYDNGSWHIRGSTYSDNHHHYYYRNRFYDIPNMTRFEFWNANVTSGPPSEIYFYHNSVSGGGNFLFTYPIPGNIPGYHFFNNIISAEQAYSNTAVLGAFDYNWVGGDFSGTESWFGSHNIKSKGQKMWDDSEMPDFLLPENSQARNAGIDLSKPFTINGKTFDPLPGMAPGYFSGTRPDLGAVQGTSPPPPRRDDPTPDTQAPTVPDGLKTTVISRSQIDLVWDRSTDNNAVAGYKVFRDGVEITTTADTSYSDRGLASATTYSYTVSAYDASGNESVPSQPISAATQSPGQPAYAVLKTGTPPNIDGELAEYSAAQTIDFSLANGENVVKIGALWDTEALYIGCEVSDSQLNANETAADGNLWNEDHIEWFIDTKNNGGGSNQPNSAYMLTDDFHGMVNILNTHYDSKGTTSGSPSPVWDGRWESVVKLDGTIGNNSDADNGYTIEIKIPWSSILESPAFPEDDSAIGMSFSVADKDADTFSFVMWPNITSAFENASKWQQVLLSGEHAGNSSDTVPPSIPKGLKVIIR